MDIFEDFKNMTIFYLSRIYKETFKMVNIKCCLLKRLVPMKFLLELHFTSKLISLLEMHCVKEAFQYKWE